MGLPVYGRKIEAVSAGLLLIERGAPAIKQLQSLASYRRLLSYAGSEYGRGLFEFSLGPRAINPS